MFHYSHNAIEKESLAKAEQMLNGKAMYIENQMHRVEVATRNMHWNVERHLDDPNAMETYCGELVMSNPNVVGCAIAFAPNFYPEKGEFYTTYVYRDEEESDFVMMTHDPFVIEPDLYDDNDYVLWQYSATGSVRGIRGNVDMSRFVGRHDIRDIQYR